MRFLRGFLTAIVVLVVGALVLVWSGSYNIAASDPHPELVRWALATTMHRSVERRAEAIEAPERFSDEQVRRGFDEFDAMCVHCHGAPGVERAGWAEGLRPRPPDLAEQARELSAAELFWVVKHGIKMTGMPSFGETHDDATVWSIVAFVDQLPSLEPQAYARLREQSAAEAGPANGHGHGHGDAHGHTHDGHAHGEHAHGHAHEVQAHDGSASDAQTAPEPAR